MVNAELIALADQVREKAQGSTDAPFWRHVETTLRAMAEQKPVAWGGYSGVGEWLVSPRQAYPFMTEPLYAAPVPTFDVDEAMRLHDVAVGHAIRVAQGQRPCNASVSRAALAAYLKGQR
jgi:hypothetical protein